MKNNPLLEDAMHMFNAGVGFMADLKDQIMHDMKERMDEKIDKLDLAKREDLDRLERQVQALQAELDTLKSKKKK